MTESKQADTIILSEGRGDYIDTGQRWVLWQVHAAQGELADNKALTAVHNQIAAEILHQIAAPITDDVLRQTFLNAPQVKRVLDTV
jgi:hypothetical protein